MKIKREIPTRKCLLRGAKVVFANYGSVRLGDRPFSALNVLGIMSAYANGAVLIVHQVFSMKFSLIIVVDCPKASIREVGPPLAVFFIVQEVTLHADFTVLVICSIADFHSLFFVENVDHFGRAIFIGLSDFLDNTIFTRSEHYG